MDHDSGPPCLGIKACGGIVLATENRTSPLADGPQHRIELVADRLAVVGSGTGAHYGLLVSQARKITANYESSYGCAPSANALASRVAAVMREYTQSGGDRPSAGSLLVAGYKAVYQCDPSGAFYACMATAIGKNYAKATRFLMKRYCESLEVDDAVHWALLTLKESVDVEVAIITATGFKRLGTV